MTVIVDIIDENVEGNLEDIEQWLAIHGRSNLWIQSMIQIKKDHENDYEGDCEVCHPHDEEDYWRIVNLHRRAIEYEFRMPLRFND